jgi:hypothetical protein
MIEFKLNNGKRNLCCDEAILTLPEEATELSIAWSKIFKMSVFFAKLSDGVPMQEI